MSFVKRTSVPAKDNKYYNSNNNPFVPAGYGMFQNNGNCTAYAWGRFYELLGSKPKLYTGNAETWWKHTEDGYQRGNTPKLGAVICWEGVGSKAGHVAIVEEVKSDGSILTSNSAWKNTVFYTKTLKPPYNMGTGYKFQGFIYHPIDFDEVVPVECPTVEETAPTEKISNDELLTLVKKTMRGDFGNGDKRVKALGDNYNEVQKQVNLNIKNKTTNWDNIKLY